jgi:electron transfer flavoprotein alpha subunit
VDADVLLVPSTYGLREAAAVAAARLKAGFVTDASALEWAGSDGRSRPLRAGKRVLGGGWDVTCEISTDPAVVTVRANAVAASPADVPTVPTVLALPVDVRDKGVLVIREDKPVDPAARPAQTEATVVVCGGRGTDGNFAPVEELADALGGAVGATRDASFEGWWPDYIGQTGLVVAPKVYIGAGVSGAPHHTAGMASSQIVVAVNNDSDAPLVEASDFAVIGDLAQILPAAAAAIRVARA